MKNLLVGILLAIGFLSALTGCEEAIELYSGPDYVRFTDTTLTFKESYGKLVPIRVHLVGAPKNEPITVQYGLSGTAIEGRDYTIEGTRGIVTIPANSHFGTFNVELINNSNNILRTQNIVFTLLNVTSSSQVSVGTGAKGTLGTSLRLTIQDDCLFGGFYDATRAQSTARVEDVEIYSTNCTDYYLNNWNVGILSFKADKLNLQFTDNGDNSITIPKQLQLSLGDTIQGNGSWDPRTRNIVLNVQLRQTSSTGQVRYTPIPAITLTPR